MTLSAEQQRMSGRIGALLGILLLALSLRAAVVSVPPLLAQITPAVGFTPLTTGFLAMLAPVCFAIFGIFTPRLINTWGLGKTLFVAIGLAVLGQLLRPFAPNAWVFLALSIVTLGGYGIGNVVLPPLVKKYFPDKIATITSGYVTLLAVGTWISPQFAVPLANAVNWEFSIAFWALLSAIVAIPWVLQLRADRAAGRADVKVQTAATTVPMQANINPWRSRVAWGLAIYLAGNSAQTYVYFTWLPPYLQDRGIDELTAGSMLAYFAILMLPVSLIIPMWVPKLKHPIVAIGFFSLFWIVGHTGLLISPQEYGWIWITFSGLAQGTFAIALLMVNLRSRTTYGSGVLSGFSQGIGYAGAAIAPMFFGIVHDATNSWPVTFLLLAAALVVMLIGAVIINPKRMIEDDAPTKARV
ncbi:MFS transporter [Micrococcoides hystricis]|uniref:CynX/NimT family MFS transporter n=1 Tax=Micrococcoides hystricis TaxID=1572761 RepID=A0ABV6P7T8_9MICC